ncbi:hypothetical protein CAI16_18615 [Virgibacillus dokdonensis]|uniref:Uncharacterized protein n=1 Tax=Virgibacillus dokdonensis TaxID=302167 RepID=A0A3E0WGY8_9BACI|nr:hypothetical protein [Virgibacillus dokdonensis]RFA32240.1 hypothetical protein CAI16_18615 [Virgibacillus dokdonensis]
MNKQVRKSLANVISGLFLMISLYLYWNVFHGTNMYSFLGILFATPIINGIMYKVLPVKGKGKKRVSSRRNNNSKGHKSKKSLSSVKKR